MEDLHRRPAESTRDQIEEFSVCTIVCLAVSLYLRIPAIVTAVR